jgi:streptogramin lyase
VKYAPDTETFTCYNLPLNNPATFGIYLEEDEDRVWVSATNMLPYGNFIASFKPSTFTGEFDTDCEEDFINDFPRVDFCGEGEEDQCFKKYVLGNSNAAPVHLAEGPNGNVWFSEFTGTAIGNVNPDTGVLTEYDMPASSGITTQALTLGSGPWTVDFDSSNNLWLIEGFDNQIIKFNPITGVLIEEYTIPNIDMSLDFAHSFDFDTDDSLWFTFYNSPEDSGGNGWVGKLTQDEEFIMFPPLSEINVSGGASGVAVHGSTQDIWFAEFWNGNVWQLTQI